MPKNIFILSLNIEKSNIDIFLVPIIYNLLLNLTIKIFLKNVLIFKLVVKWKKLVNKINIIFYCLFQKYYINKIYYYTIYLVFVNYI